METPKIHIIISTPLGIYFDKEASICTFTTTEGQIGIMAGATEFMAALVPSKIMVDFLNSPDSKVFYIDKGIVQFKNNVLSIIVNQIDTKEIELDHKFSPEDQKKYTIIEEVTLKKSILKSQTNNK